MCLPNESIYPTEWAPLGEGLEQRQIGPKDFEVRYASDDARRQAVKEFAARLAGRPRVCDHCSGPIEGGRFAYLCDRCSRIETDAREIAERIGRTA